MSESWPPAGAEQLLAFDVIGSPKGAGSKDAIPLGRWVTENGKKRFIAAMREGGVPIVNVVDSSGKAGENWRADIRAAAAAALDVVSSIEDGPVAMRATFYGERPGGHYGSRKGVSYLKDSADRYPHRSKLPDGTKLARALEDALNELVWADDRRVCELWWSRRWSDEWEHGRQGAHVEIWTLPARIDPPATEPAQESLLSPDQSVIMGGDGDHGDTEKESDGARAAA